jgi:hypothetical protein
MQEFLVLTCKHKSHQRYCILGDRGRAGVVVATVKGRDTIIDLCLGGADKAHRNSGFLASKNPSSKANGQHWREVAADRLVLLGLCQLVNSMDGTSKKN